MKFSIVTPVKNGGRFLNATIESIRNQTHEDWEYVIVDGGSTDESLSIAQSHAADDDRIKLITGPDGGMYDAISNGFGQTGGEMVAWLNADDLYVPWAFAKVEEYVSRTGAAWVTGLPGLWDSAGILKLIKQNAWYPRSFIKNGYFHENLLGSIQQESVFFTRALFTRLSDDEINKFKAMTFAGDYYLWRRFAAYEPLKTIPTLLGGFRRHDQNASIRNFDAYMNEVKETGAGRVPQRSGRRLGRVFSYISSMRTTALQWAEEKEFDN